MNIDSLYNEILNRGWLGQMKAIASPYHQRLKFPSKHGIDEIRNKQEDVCYCFELVVQSALAN